MEKKSLNKENMGEKREHKIWKVKFKTITQQTRQKIGKLQTEA